MNCDSVPTEFNWAQPTYFQSYFCSMAWNKRQEIDTNEYNATRWEPFKQRIGIQNRQRKSGLKCYITTGCYQGSVSFVYQIYDDLPPLAASPRCCISFFVFIGFTFILQSNVYHEIMTHSNEYNLISLGFYIPWQTMRTNDGFDLHLRPFILGWHTQTQGNVVAFDYINAGSSFVSFNYHLISMELVFLLCRALASPRFCRYKIIFIVSRCQTISSRVGVCFQPFIVIRDRLAVISCIHFISFESRSTSSVRWFDGGSCLDALWHCQVIINRTEWSSTRELSILFDRMKASFFRLAFATI